MNTPVRVRFAPSPTGGLHLGGVRTALFNYLFAKQHQGTFILRIEDTDQNRFVPGAEQYIQDCLSWCGIIPDESPSVGGPFAPYRQSERKQNYLQYAQQLVQQGNAYYAFDTTEELQAAREKHPNFQYGRNTRAEMRNSISLDGNTVAELLQNGTPYVIRFKSPDHETVTFTDMIRGEVRFDTQLLDDKVLLKADGMPTYHLAVVVDDYEMQISHIFRGEEWLPSAPIHILLWKYLGWEKVMPHWAHLPLILKPDGNGKLSKRDGDRLGFPVYAMNWTAPESHETTIGFKEKGFLPQAFVNMLALLGWNDGTDQELFPINQLIEKFSVERISKAGAKFDYEKAKWFNQEWIKTTSAVDLLPYISAHISSENHEKTLKIIDLIKDRCVFLEDLWTQSQYFFNTPSEYDIASFKNKWNPEKTAFFETLLEQDVFFNTPDVAEKEQLFKDLATEKQLKVGELMLPFRIMLVGGKFGPQVFEIASYLSKNEISTRVHQVLSLLNAANENN